jgi:hypothetical protein
VAGLHVHAQELTMRLALLPITASILFAVGCASSDSDPASQTTADLATNDSSHFVHCDHQDTQITFEQTATEYTLKVREEAYQGHTLGLLLDSTLAPDFFRNATGNFIELTLHFALGNGTCQYSATRGTLFNCGGGYPTPSMPPVATLTDGVISVALDDTGGNYHTELRHVEAVNTSLDGTVLHFELFGPSHPWPTGYIREEMFANETCTTTKPRN